MVDDRIEKGFNIGQLFVPGNLWGRESSLHNETYSALDTDHVRKVEQIDCLCQFERSYSLDSRLVEPS